MLVEDSDAAVVSSVPARRKFQFGLRTLLVVMTGFAVLLSALFAGPIEVSFLVMMGVILAVPMCLTIGIVYGRDYLRTFCIGGVFPCGSIVLGASLYVFPGIMYYLPSDGFEGAGNATFVKLVMAVSILVGVLVTLAFGAAACGVRWLIERQNRVTTEDESPSTACEG